MNQIIYPPFQSITEFYPIGGGGDDAPRFQLLAESVAYKKNIQMMPGIYSWQTICSIPSGTTIIGGPDVKIVSIIPPTDGGFGSPEQTVFYAIPPTATIITTLTSPTTLGSSIISVTSSIGFSIGMEIAISNANHTAGYVITAINGNNITVDRQILHSFPVLDTSVFDRTVPKDIKLFGNGMKVSGTGDAFIEWSGAWRCHVEGINVTPEDGYFQYVIVNFDVGSRECTFKDSFLDGDGYSDSCWHFESAENCKAERIRARGAFNQAIFLSSGYGCSLDSCSAENSTTGATLNTAVGTNGTKACTLINCTFTGNSGIGLNILNGSNYVNIIGCDARYNGGTGFAVNSGTGPSHHITFTSCRALGNTGAGFYVVVNCYDVNLIGCSADECNSFGIEGEGIFSITNYSSRNCRLGGIRVGAGGRSSAQQVTLVATQDTSAAAWAAFTQQSTDLYALRIVDAMVEMSGVGTKSVISSQATGIMYAENLISIGGTFGWVASNGTFIRGNRVNLNSTITPYLGGIIRDSSELMTTPTNNKTSLYNAIIGDCVLCDPTSSGFTVNLPTAAFQMGRTINVVNNSASTNTITIVPNGSETINGVNASVTITTVRQSLTFKSIETGWIII